MTDPCEHFQGLIAMEVIGQLSVNERVALSAHTEGCASCRDERQDLMMLSMVLGAADPDRFNEHELPFELQTAVLDRLRAEERRERRAHRSRYIVGSAAAAVAVAVVLVLSLAWPSGPTATTVALVGLPTVHATARLTAGAVGDGHGPARVGTALGRGAVGLRAHRVGLVVADRHLPHRRLVGPGHHGVRAHDVEDQERVDPRELGTHRPARIPGRGQDARPELTRSASRPDGGLTTA